MNSNANTKPDKQEPHDILEVVNFCNRLKLHAEQVGKWIMGNLSAKAQTVHPEGPQRLRLPLEQPAEEMGPQLRHTEHVRPG